MSGDLGGTFVLRRDAAVHAAVVEAARGLLPRFSEADLQRSRASYALSKRVPAGMGLCLSGPPPLEDAYRWHMDETEFPAALASALGCEVWCLAWHGVAGGYAAREYRPGAGLAKASSAETPVGFLSCAKALQTDLETVRQLLDELAWGRGPSQSLADADTAFLAPVVAALDADESARFPGREDFKVWLPGAVIAEIEEAARRTQTDPGIVLWCAWEWAKPGSFEAFSRECGKKRKGPKAQASGALLPGPEQPPPALPESKSAQLQVWLPSRVMKEMNDIAEACERGATWAFLTAYRRSRPLVLGCRRARSQ